MEVEIGSAHFLSLIVSLPSAAASTSVVGLISAKYAAS